MSLLDKQHIALVLLDENNTPLSNEKTEAIQWFRALGDFGQKLMILDNDLEYGNISWSDILQVYRKLHYAENYES
ncbi:MAG: hypothetical protein Crog4KO_25840 [Crocinitomicaceae bacterium]